MNQIPEQGSINTYHAIVSMLKNTGYHLLADYMKEHQDENLLQACATCIIHKTKPQHMENVLSQLMVIGVL